MKALKITDIRKLVKEIFPDHPDKQKLELAMIIACSAMLNINIKHDE